MVIGVADPDIEVGVDPRTGKDATQWRGRRLDRLAHRDGLQLGVRGQRRVQRPKEDAPALVSSSVLAGQDDRHHGSGPRSRQNRRPLRRRAHEVGAAAVGFQLA